MAEKPKQHSIPKEFLRAELGKSQSSLDSLYIVAEKIIRNKMGGRTDKGNKFVKVWQKLWCDLQEDIDAIQGEEITSKNELDEICGQVKKGVYAVVGEFNKDKCHESIKTLMQNLRQQRHRVMNLVDQTFELPIVESGAEADEPKVAEKSEEELEEEDTEEEVAPRGMMPCPDDAETSRGLSLVLMEILLFDVFRTFKEGLRKVLNPEDETLGEESFKFLDYFVDSLGKLMKEVGELLEKKFGNGAIMEFEEFKDFLIAKAQESKPSKDTRGYGEYDKKNPYQALIEGYFGRFIERIKEFESAKEFYDFSVAPENKPESKTLSNIGFDAERLFLPRKSKHISERGAEIDEDRGILLLGGEEKQVLREEWYSRRTGGDHDFLSHAAKKEIAVVLNARFHGGLDFRTVGNIKKLMEDLQEEDAALGAAVEKDARALREWHNRLLECVCGNYTVQFVNKTVELVRKRLEESQQAKEGTIVVFDKRFFQQLMEVLAAVEQRVKGYLDSYKTNYLDNPNKFRNLFATALTDTTKKNPLADDFLKVADIIEAKSSVLGLKPEDIDQLKLLAVDCNFVLERVGQHATANPATLEVKTCNAEVVARSTLLGPLTSSMDEGYTGNALPAEWQFLKSCCDLVQISPEDTVDSALEKCSGDGTMVSWVNEMNDHLYGGVSIRRLSVVQGFVREIFTGIVVEKRREERGRKRLITPELQARIDSAIAWVSEVKDLPGRVYKTMLLAFASKLDAEHINEQPLYITEYFVRRLEFCRERHTLDERGAKPYLRPNLGLDDMIVLLDVPVPTSARHPELDKITMRLEDIDMDIARLRERLKEGGKKAEELQGKLDEKKALEVVITACTEQIGGINDSIASCHNRVAAIYGQVVNASDEQYDAAKRKVDVIDGEINTLRQCRTVQETILKDKQRELDTLNIEIQQFETVVRQGDPRLEQEIADLEGVKRKFLADLDALFQSSYNS